jgi:hypothetical protein
MSRLLGGMTHPLLGQNILSVACFRRVIGQLGESQQFP